MDFTPLSTLLSANNHYAIPDYQREYSWSDTENGELWTDLLHLVFGDEDTEHFFGAIVTADYSPEESQSLRVMPEQFNVDRGNISHIIDGQQRLTSFSILLGVLRGIVSADESLDEVVRAGLLYPINEMLSVRSKKCGSEEAPRLFTKDQSGSRYYERVLKITPTEKADMRYKAARRVDNAAAFYRRAIDDLVESMTEEETMTRHAVYESLLEAIRNRSQFCIIHCQSKMNEFQVFESLNGKGMELTAADRIKNLYMSKARQSQIPNTVKLWEVFSSKLDNDEAKMIHFFISFFFYQDEKRVGKVQLAKRFSGMLNSEDTFQVFNAKLTSAADCYGRIRNSDTGHKELDSILDEAAQMNSEQIYVPLFALVKRYGMENDCLPAIVRALVNYMVRYLVCGNPMNRLDSEFANLISYIKGDEQPNEESVLKYILQRTEEDERFQEFFAEYRTQNAKFARYILEKIERYQREMKGNGNPLGVDQSLEHIIPKRIEFSDWYGEGHEPSEVIRASYSEDYIDSIGNMALLEQCDNSSAGNRNYEAKKDIYRYGQGGEGKTHPVDTYELIDELLNKFPDKFTHEEVGQRAKLLSEYICRIWHSQP